MINQEIVELLGQRVQLIDLSRSLEPTVSEPTPPRIQHISHKDCAEMWEFMFGIPSNALPNGLGFAGEIVEASTHASTHLDAPWHYAPTSEGQPAWTIDETPLHWFVGQAVVLDVSDLPTGYLVTPEEIEKCLKKLSHTIKPGEIVLFCTGADAVWGTEEFFSYGCGLGEEAVLYLVDQGVRVIGTDAWSLDRPYPIIGNEWAIFQDSKRLWSAHFAGIKRKYSQIEKLTNLSQLPPVGSTILCFPIKVKGGSGAWSRVIGLVPTGEKVD
ncbi:cyclase family protein [Gloeocapsopsis sp. IPPAS B-1203]|uniref:cyclase family protein n=1 Tax=Gloeocapsopsis sp. IPPAS B-1203 TaxID=2049454 RepID=UPI0025A05659|nr:cyclase family protein [Gloeocapsopsis sp. IPPAS B-1203]